MRFNNNYIIIEKLLAILLLINLIKSTKSVINGSETLSQSSNTQQNHITATNRPINYGMS